ncbi:protein of unknown function DUF107 [Isosphaera pallida ATCC 43644]|uniref:NfeD-like C-terminal domain-containing protein n=1 Tax=Isosphaera pallida (strain ATCC 43644 / DSM 9630 / IS1B) TaxID=575540 RepID=E8R0T3_ISOPI|nr:NfeD family protein [Isosphaera pallida]ADV62279.1 protein of unknown function DUF107 [Isosphaera pallida ATCC 43644]
MLPAHLLWPTIFLTLGFLMLMAEVFIPSGGLIGLAALTFLGLSLWHAFSYSTSLGLTFMLTMAIVLPFVVSFMIYMWPRTPLGRRMILAPPGEDEEEPDAESFRESERSLRLDRLVGEYGKTLTPLRPSGAVEFNNRRLDALAEEGLVPAGKLVRAVGTRGCQLIVRQVDETMMSQLIHGDLDLDSHAESPRNPDGTATTNQTTAAPPEQSPSTQAQPQPRRPLSDFNLD